MKLVTAAEQEFGSARLTDISYFQTSVTSISFLNAIPINFLNAFFLRWEEEYNRETKIQLFQ